MTKVSPCPADGVEIVSVLEVVPVLEVPLDVLLAGVDEGMTELGVHFASVSIAFTAIKMS
jgi:hypothetical protein